MLKKLLLSAVILVSAQAQGAQNHLNGNISNFTATVGGLMIMLDAGIPDNCAGTPYGWMMIKQEHTTLTSTVLALILAGKKKGTVYTTGIDASGHCIVSQFHPAQN